MRRLHIILLLHLLIAVPSHSQEMRESRIAVSTNALDYARLLTPNLDVQYAAGRSVSILAGAKYNGWSVNKGTDKEFKDRNQTYYAGMRWWPWYTFSGWWVGSSIQFQEYDRGGLLRSDAEAGNAFGMGISGGYAIQLSRFLNLDLGLGFWGGMTNYTHYSCPYCGKIIDEGNKFFFLPNEARLALQFIF